MRISTFAQNTLVKQNILRLQNEMLRAQNQLATGKRDDPGVSQALGAAVVEPHLGPEHDLAGGGARRREEDHRWLKNRRSRR